LPVSEFNLLTDSSINHWLIEYIIVSLYRLIVATRFSFLIDDTINRLKALLRTHDC